MSLRSTPDQSPPRSVTNTDELEQIETGSLVDGDEAFTRATTQYWRLSKSSTAATSAEIVFTKNSNGGSLAGRWFLKPVPEEVPFDSLLNIAALAALDDTGFVEGQVAYVQSVQSYWNYVIEADPGTADGITIVRASSGTATWYREQLANRVWNNTLTWYISAAAGNDENDGAAAITPLRTLGELTRRTVGAEPRPNFTLQVLNSGTTPLTGVWELNVVSFVDVFGEVLVGPSAIISAVQNFNRPTNTPQRVTAPWPAPQDAAVIPMWGTSGGLVGWRTFTIAGNDFETKFWDLGGNYTDPLVGDTVEEQRRPYIGNTTNAVRVQLNGAAIEFYNLVTRTVISAGGGSAYFERCNIFRNSQFDDGRFIEKNLCFLQTGGSETVAVFNTPTFGIFASVASTVFARVGVTVEASDDTLFNASDGKIFFIGGDARFTGSVEARRTVSGAFEFQRPESSMSIETAVVNGTYLYGNGSTGPIIDIIVNGVRVYYTDQASLVAATTGNQWERPVATSGTFAALPTVDATRFVGIVPHTV